MLPLLRAARGYVERLGFPLVVADASKRPVRLFPHGASSATRDVALIERGIASTPGATLATRIGERVVLDVDVRHGGEEDLAKLVARYGPLPVTWTQQTPTGGLHVWLCPVDFKPRGRIAPGIEVLTGNRLVTLSPSMRLGARYRWIEHPLKVKLAEAPRWLIAAMQPPPAPPRPRVDSSASPEQREKRCRAYVATMDPAISGQQGHARTFLAALVATRGFNLEADRALAVLLDEFNGRCAPPWTERELRRKVHEAIRRGSMPWGAMLTERSAA